MIVGKLYRLTELEKTKIVERNVKWRARFVAHNVEDVYGIDVYDHKLNRKVHPIDTLIVPLEIHTVSIGGKPLSGEGSRRLVALLTTGDIGTMYVSINEWEEVTQSL